MDSFFCNFTAVAFAPTKIQNVQTRSRPTSGQGSQVMLCPQPSAPTPQASSMPQRRGMQASSRGGGESASWLSAVVRTGASKGARESTSSSAASPTGRSATSVDSGVSRIPPPTSGVPGRSMADRPSAASATGLLPAPLPQPKTRAMKAAVTATFAQRGARCCRASVGGSPTRAPRGLPA
jgi:hypothetical protein